MDNTTGIFTISLDFELYWGIRDKRTVESCKENLKGVQVAIKRMLELFERYEIHATWATVGMLFASNKDELQSYLPEREPNYLNSELNPYHYINSTPNLEHDYHFASELIDLILKYRHQEIGTHSFSHYYCLEKGQVVEDFQSDIKAAINIAKSKEVSLKSFVFPRNQWNGNYLKVLNDCGIDCYRGNEEGWLYKAVDESGQYQFRRAARLLDAYLNISGTHSYPLKTIAKSKPYNIPSSRFLRPYSKKLSILENLRKKRILNGVKHAAKKKELFHLWWHPHNFGVNIGENIAFLEDILAFYAEMKSKYGMRSLSMKEVSEILNDLPKCG